MNTEEYRRMFAVEDRHWWYRALHGHIRWALERHAPHAGRIVDIGCGTGAVAAQFSESAAVIGLDYALAGLALCRERGLRNLARADAARLPIAGASADAVLLLDLLYHQNVTDPLTVLREAHRILAPGGVVVVNVPAYAWLRSSHDVAVHTARRFTRPAVNRLLREAGFAVEFSSYWNTMLFPAIALVRLARRGQPDRGSDLDTEPPPSLRAALNAIMALEAACMRRAPLPFGVSIFAVARRPAE